MLGPRIGSCCDPSAGAGCEARCGFGGCGWSSISRMRESSWKCPASIMRQRLQVGGALADELPQPAGRGHHDPRPAGELPPLLVQREAADQRDDAVPAQQRARRRNRLQVRRHLRGQLTGRRHDEREERAAPKAARGDRVCGRRRSRRARRLDVRRRIRLGRLGFLDEAMQDGQAKCERLAGPCLGCADQVAHAVQRRRQRRLLDRRRRAEALRDQTMHQGRVEPEPLPIQSRRRTLAFGQLAARRAAALPRGGVRGVWSSQCHASGLAPRRCAPARRRHDARIRPGLLDSLLLLLLLPRTLLPRRRRHAVAVAAAIDRAISLRNQALRGGSSLRIPLRFGALPFRSLIPTGFGWRRNPSRLGVFCGAFGDRLIGGSQRMHPHESIDLCLRLLKLCAASIIAICVVPVSGNVAHEDWWRIGRVEQLLLTLLERDKSGRLDEAEALARRVDGLPAGPQRRAPLAALAHCPRRKHPTV
eukprot:scaffold2603_cov100-Isochrysis_galbana.AAC.2